VAVSTKNKKQEKTRKKKLKNKRKNKRKTNAIQPEITCRWFKDKSAFGLLLQRTSICELLV
jgi:hypothetical protein